MKLKDVKTTTNLRDFYIRSLLLGGQNEEINNITDSNDIEEAFMDAGKVFNGQ